MSGPYCPVNKVQLKTSVRVHEILFSQHRPIVHHSPNGVPASFVPYDNSTKIAQRAVKGWKDVYGATEIMLRDVDRCIAKNPDHYVAIAGIDNNNALMTLHTVYEPPRRNPIYPVVMDDLGNPPTVNDVY